MHFNFHLIAGATALSLAVSPAFAATREARSVTVEYKDLDLGTEEGQNRLDYRLMAGLRKICGRASQHDFVGSDDSRQCRAEAAPAIETQRAAILAKWESSRTLANADGVAPRSD